MKVFIKVFFAFSFFDVGTLASSMLKFKDLPILVLIGLKFSTINGRTSEHELIPFLLNRIWGSTWNERISQYMNLNFSRWMRFAQLRHIQKYNTLSGAKKERIIRIRKLFPCYGPNRIPRGASMSLSTSYPMFHSARP